MSVKLSCELTPGDVIACAGMLFLVIEVTLIKDRVLTREVALDTKKTTSKVTNWNYPRDQEHEILR